MSKYQSLARPFARLPPNTPLRRIVATHPATPDETKSRAQAVISAAKVAGCISMMKGENGGT